MHVLDLIGREQIHGRKRVLQLAVVDVALDRLADLRSATVAPAAAATAAPCCGARRALVTHAAAALTRMADPSGS